MRVILILIACVLTVGAARASLEWENTKVELQAKVTEINGTAAFKFVNEGDQPVKIERIDLGCGCLDYKLDKRDYAPGEFGTLQITLDYRGRSGLTQKKAAVRTSDGREIQLTVEADIPVLYQISPQVVRWDLSHSEGARTVKLVNQSKVAVKLISIQTSNKNITVELNTIREGFEYDVVLTRKTLNERIRALIRVKTESEKDVMDERIYRIFATTSDK